MPKIMIETGMTETPISCRVCDICARSLFTNNCACRWTGDTVLLHAERNTRPNWCPLREGELRRIGSEPDTAEKLLWLVEKGLEIYTVLDGETHLIDRKELYFCANDGKSRTAKVNERLPLFAAIDRMYEFVKEQENG